MATIQGVYVALFGRPADPTGLNYFNGVTNNGADLTAIGDLASTQEYKDRFAGQTNAQIITSIYQSLFDRNPEQAGLDFFVNALANGTFNINNIAIAILDGAQGDDLTLVNKKIAAADLFTAAIDTPDEIAAYQGTAAAQSGIDFVDAVTATSPVVDAAAADTAIAALPAPGTGTPGGTFTLTTGLDFANSSTAFINGAIPSDFKFTGNNETVEALDGTMAAADTLIDGATGDMDTLNIRSTGTAPVLGTITNIENINYVGTAGDFSGQNLATVTGAKSLTVSGTTAAGSVFTNAGGTGITTFDFSGVTTTGATGGVSVAMGSTIPTADLTMTGGAGNDSLFAGNGNDTLMGGAGDDTITGLAGNDVITGGAGADALTGGAGNDTFNIDAGTDNIVDLLTGDIIKVSSGATLTTTAGSVSAFVATADSSNEGTATINAVATGASIDVSLATGSKGFTIAGGAGKDTIVGGANADTISSGGGDDTITGGGGKDAITGGGGVDTLVFGSGDSGLTTATADTVAAFTSATDKLKVGLAANGTNFTDGGAGGTTLEAAVTAANAAFNGTVRYYFVDDSTDGFFVADLDGDGSADIAVALTGVTAIVAGDIIA